VRAPAGYQHPDGDQHAGAADQHADTNEHADTDALVQQPPFLPEPGAVPRVVATSGRHLLPLEGRQGSPPHNRSLVSLPPRRF
jgi:hypothetical protein